MSRRRDCPGNFSWAEEATEKITEITEENSRAAYNLNNKHHKPFSCRKNCRLNPNCLSGFGESAWKEPIGKENPLSSSKRQSGSYVGLKNLGNTCYISSLLQLWFHTLPLREAVYLWNALEDKYERQKHYEVFGKESDVVNFKPLSSVAHLQFLFAEMEFGHQTYCDPEAFCRSLSIDVELQQDANEFSKLYMHRLEEIFVSASNEKTRNVVQSQFRGEYSYVTTCSKCKTASRRDSFFYELELSVKGYKTILDSLNEFVRDEHLVGDNKYLCSVCNSKEEAVTGIKLQLLPPMLQLQLIRYCFDMTTASKKKISQAIQFPDILDMSPYLNRPNGSILYSLQAVLMHGGSSADSGHYFSHIKTVNGWHVFDDTIVKKQKQLSLINDDPMIKPTTDKKPPKLKGFRLSSSAYMLVYKKVETERECLNNVKPVKSDNDVKLELPFSSGKKATDEEQAFKVKKEEICAQCCEQGSAAIKNVHEVKMLSDNSVVEKQSKSANVQASDLFNDTLCNDNECDKKNYQSENDNRLAENRSPVLGRILSNDCKFVKEKNGDGCIHETSPKILNDKQLETNGVAMKTCLQPKNSEMNLIESANSDGCAEKMQFADKIICSNDTLKYVNNCEIENGTVGDGYQNSGKINETESDEFVSIPFHPKVDTENQYPNAADCSEMVSSEQATPGEGGASPPQNKDDPKAIEIVTDLADKHWELLPEYLKNYIQREKDDFALTLQNQLFDIESRRKHQELIKDLLDVITPQVPIDLKKCEFLNYETFINLVKSCEVPPVDNTSILCEHNFVNFNKLRNYKLVSVEAANNLFGKFGGGPRMPGTSLCKDCLLRRAELTRARAILKSDIKTVSVLLKVTVLEEEPSFWISKKSLKTWWMHVEKRIDEQEEQFSFDNSIDVLEVFNSEILCSHGNLIIDESERQLISMACWDILKKYFPNRKELDKSYSPCFQCQADADLGKINEEHHREKALMEKESLITLFNEKRENPDALVGECFLISSTFVSAWRRYVRSAVLSVLKERPLSNLLFDPILCIAHSLLIYNPNSESDRFVVTTESEWSVIKQLYDPSSEISLSKSDMGFWTPSIKLCSECIANRKTSEEVNSLEKSYTRAKIYVFKVANEVDDEPPPNDVKKNSGNRKRKNDNFVPAVPHSAKKIIVSEPRRSARSRMPKGDREGFLIDKFTTVKNLKTMICTKMDVMPSDQHLYLETGEDLDELQATLSLSPDEATLLRLKVPPYSTLRLVADEPNVDQEFLAEGRRLEPETGFKGTELGGR